MKFIALFAIYLVSFANECRAKDIPSNGTDGFGYQLLLAKMEHLEYELKAEIKDQGEMLRQLLQTRCSETLEQQRSFLKNETLTIQSCTDEKAKNSGRYKLKVLNTTIEVYCEQQLHGTGWILIQNRFNGSVSFDRNWTEYRNGFGDLEGEFWWGLENIHMLTSSNKYELLVHLEDFDGNVKHIKYEEFSIGNEHDKYTLHVSNKFTGTLGDSLGENHNGKQFSSIDQDNDLYDQWHCAQAYSSGWWFTDCYYANLNGVYRDENGMSWYKFNNDHTNMKISKMMIREK